MDPPSAQQVTQALAGVLDPEIRRPITELGMVKHIDVAADGTVAVEVYLTVAGCPMKDTITREVTAAVGRLPGVSSVRVGLDVMSDEQRRALQTQLRGGRPEPQIPFAQPTSLTRVYAVASGKGGVGKSSVTVNLAAALAASGQKVGVVDADIYGHSVPRMLGVTGRPTPVENMIMPPSAHDVKVISIGMFTKGNTPVVWRGPMLHRALQQFLADVYWGDLDVLLLDLPPGTGDVAISVAQMLPGADLLVVTTPQLAAAEVAERAGAITRYDRLLLLRGGFRRGRAGDDGLREPGRNGGRRPRRVGPARSRHGNGSPGPAASFQRAPDPAFPAPRLRGAGRELIPALLPERGQVGLLLEPVAAVDRERFSGDVSRVGRTQRGGPDGHLLRAR